MEQHTRNPQGTTSKGTQSKSTSSFQAQNNRHSDIESANFQSKSPTGNSQNGQRNRPGEKTGNNSQWAHGKEYGKHQRNSEKR